MSKKFCFRGCFVKEYVKDAQKLLKSALHHLDHIVWSAGRKYCSEKSSSLTCQISGLLVNTFATDEKYPILNRDNLAIYQLLASAFPKLRTLTRWSNNV